MYPYQSMRTCVRLLQQRKCYDDYGDPSESWVDIGRYWAKIAPKPSTNGKPTFAGDIRHPRMRIDRLEWDGKVYRLMGPFEEDARRTWRRFVITEI